MNQKFRSNEIGSPKVKLLKILGEHAETRVNGWVVSDRTSNADVEVLQKCLIDLHMLGYRLKEPQSLSAKGMQDLCRMWYQEGKKPFIMQKLLIKLRVFSGWIGKPNIFKSLTKYLPGALK